MDKIKENETTTCGQTSITQSLTDQVVDRFASLEIQTQHIKDLVSKTRDVLGIYNMPAQLGEINNVTPTCGEPDAVQPTISCVSRKMLRLIEKNDRLISDFENLLKNL